MIKKLYQPVENAPLILFRILFGIVFFCESIGSLITGWAKDNFVNVTTNFTFIGFEWLQFLTNESIYLAFIIMAICSVNIVIGWKYKINVALLFIIWGMVYLGQKTSYNNHYYLMWILTFVMFFVPANAYASVDSKNNKEIYSLTAPRWSVIIFPVIISLVYFYATVAKFYPDWLNGTVTRNMFSNTQHINFLNPLFQKNTFHLFIAYMGICFDGLIIPTLIYKRTRVIAVIASLIFHLFNSIVLKIGVFPYFSLSFCLFFFPAETIRNLFFKNKPQLKNLTSQSYYTTNSVVSYILVPFIALQATLPLRHWLIKGDVLYTEEGHRLSWRMMLRSRSGEAKFTVENKKTGEKFIFDNKILLTNKQRKQLNSPDIIWQMAQKIKNYYKEKGIDVAVFCTSSSVIINEKYHNQFINAKVDLTNELWHWYKHEDWILDEITKTPLGPILH